MTSHLLHGLWTPDSGLCLWVEQVEGHRIVLPANVPSGVFPPQVEALLARKSFRHRLTATMRTPKGKMVRLAIPAAAFAPEDAVRTLATLQFLESPSPAATREQRLAIAPDLYWLIRMYSGLEQFVRAGRVVVGCRRIDGAWYPEWQLVRGVQEHTWLSAMTAAMPGVLVANATGELPDIMATALTHWIAVALLADFAEEPRPHDFHAFSQALLHSTPLRRGSAEFVNALRDWRESITQVEVGLVIVVDQPDEETALGNPESGAARSRVLPARVDVDTPDPDPAPAQWHLRVQVRLGVGSPEPVHTARFDAIIRDPLEEQYRKALTVSPALRGPHPPTPGYGDGDVTLTSDELVEFVRHEVPALKAIGVPVMLPKSWRSAAPKARLVTTGASAADAKIGLDQLVEYDWKVSLGDVELTDDEMRELVHSSSGLVNLRGQWVMADTHMLRRITEYVDQLSKGSRSKRRAELESAVMRAELAQANGSEDAEDLARKVEELRREFNRDFMPAGEVTLAELRQLALESAATDPIEFTGSTWHSSLLGGTATPAPARREIPDTVHAELREYQRRGVDWLAWMSENNLGAVLADDMGLGKTLQLLVLLAVERAETPTLVVCPTSVVGNWAAEAARFVPSLKVQTHYGSHRLEGEEFLAAAQEADLVITSYGIATRDYRQLSGVKWDRVVLDEAQQIKNSATRTSRAVRAIPSRHRIALTGTPVENRLAEMWSILDFCNPGILGSASFFTHHFATAIERTHDPEMTERLKLLTAPFIMRRLKTDKAIIDDLPEKAEEIVTVTLTAEQAALYKSLTESVKARMAEAKGIRRRGLILSTITRIKQICNHPAHFLGDGSAVTVRGKHRSGKVAALVELLDAAVAAGERTLIFTQYRAFGEILAGYLSERYAREIPFLHGGVSKSGRDRLVAQFQAEDGPPAMILSLKAGGTGLNLTAASRVVHMDRWWNPAVENQATDRAFRIGQRRDVKVYKMVTRGTMEESIQDILDGKLELAGAIVTAGEGWITELDQHQLAQLLSYRGRED